ncbi:unnamed protein product [Sphagnum jensenii]|uniref:Uncharacterized protein n=1 Tax=Sphagnum jensenii TaxID=128206 RepID=A0ABP1BBQ6_9BRYO
MASGFGGMSLDAACNDKITEGAQLCPFLRNIGVATSFSFSSLKFPVPAPTRALRGPIFEDGPGFENAFRLFHGRDGVVPLSEKQTPEMQQPRPPANDAASVETNLGFHPLSASSAATISLSSFGAFGPFSFDGFMARQNSKKPTKSSKRKSKKEDPEFEKDTQKSESNSKNGHEAMGSDWLATGNCPIAKSFRAVSGVLPLVSQMLKLPLGMKYRCPPAIVAARAALAKTSAVKALRPQALPTKVLAIGILGMALNVPLGVWREHTKKFSPQWFLAVHATIPFIAMLRKAVVMPKYAVAFTIGSAVLGQAIGARAEKIRLLEAAKLCPTTECTVSPPHGLVEALPCEAEHAKLCATTQYTVPLPHVSVEALPCEPAKAKLCVRTEYTEPPCVSVETLPCEPAEEKLYPTTEYMEPLQMSVEALPSEPVSKLSFDKHKLSLDASKREEEKQHVMVPKSLPCGSEAINLPQLTIVSLSSQSIDAC